MCRILPYLHRRAVPAFLASFRFELGNAGRRTDGIMAWIADGALCRGQEKQLDRDQHEERLEEDFFIRVTLVATGTAHGEPDR